MSSVSSRHADEQTHRGSRGSVAARSTQGPRRALRPGTQAMCPCEASRTACAVASKDATESPHRARGRPTVALADAHATTGLPTCEVGGWPARGAMNSGSVVSVPMPSRAVRTSSSSTTEAWRRPDRLLEGVLERQLKGDEPVTVTVSYGSGAGVCSWESTGSSTTHSGSSRPDDRNVLFSGQPHRSGGRCLTAISRHW